MQYKNKEVHICFSKHENEALRIDIVSEAFEQLETCTIATEAHNGYQDQKGLSEAENRQYRVRHLLNLIVGINLKNPEAIVFLQEQGIIGVGMAYCDKDLGVGYYYLTEDAIDQKADIVDEDAAYDDYYNQKVRDYFQHTKKSAYKAADEQRKLEGIKKDLQFIQFPLHLLQGSKKEQAVQKLLYFRKKVKIG